MPAHRKSREVRPGAQAARLGSSLSRLSWPEKGLCRETGAFLFDEVPNVRGADRTEGERHKSLSFRKSEKRRAVAQKVCQVCPVFDECATHVMSAGESYGVWAGLSPKQRKRIWNTHDTVAERVARAKAIVFSAPVALGGMTLPQLRASRVRRAVAATAFLVAEETALDEAAVAGVDLGSRLPDEASVGVLGSPRPDVAMRVVEEAPTKMAHAS